MRKPQRYNFFVAVAICSDPIPFLLFLKHPFNYLTGQWFQTIVVKNCPGSVGAHRKQEKYRYVPTG